MPLKPEKTPNSLGDALKYALRLLGYSDRSVGEMRQKLAGKGFPDEVIDKTLSYLEEKGFVDDRKLAELLRNDAVGRRHLGAQGVRSYLLRRGFAKDIADEMSVADNDYLGSAMQLVEKRMRSMGHLDSNTIKRRLWGLLARRGYAFDEIRKALEKIEDKNEG
ncbi:MAG: regulatory protein RecX [Nitrospirae bacterium]|nr:regulatory protein RecX [Nitrospirota bacterium]